MTPLKQALEIEINWKTQNVVVLDIQMKIKYSNNILIKKKKKKTFLVFIDSHSAK